MTLMQLRQPKNMVEITQLMFLQWACMLSSFTLYMCYIAKFNMFFSTSHFVTQTMAHLKQLLDTINVTYTEKIFESENGIAELGPEPFVSK